MEGLIEIWNGFISFLEGNENSPGRVVLSFLVGSVAGGLLKYCFDELSARNQTRRELVKSVTTNIEGLAKQYYWSLANLAGILATQLQEHLNALEQLQLRQDTPSALRQELDALAKVTAQESIGYYAHFTKLTSDFDLKAGNTFFLKDYWAGCSIRDLQNEIRRVFADIKDSDIIRVMNEVSTEADTTLPSKAASKGSEEDAKPSNPKKSDKSESAQQKADRRNTIHTPADLGRHLETEIAETYNDYIALLKDKHRVHQAQQYLYAYHELFRDELKILYKDWFSESWGSRHNISSTPPARRKLRAIHPSAQRTILSLAKRRRRYAEMVPISGLSSSSWDTGRRSGGSVTATGASSGGGFQRTPSPGKEPSQEDDFQLSKDSSPGGKDETPSDETPSLDKPQRERNATTSSELDMMTVGEQAQ